MQHGETIKALRMARGYTLEELGNLVGVGKSTVRKWENGDIENMRRDKIIKLANALDVSPLDILGLRESRRTFFPRAGSSSNYYVHFTKQQIAQLSGLFSVPLSSTKYSSAFIQAQCGCQVRTLKLLNDPVSENGADLPFLDLFSLAQFLDVFQEFLTVCFPKGNSDTSDNSIGFAAPDEMQLIKDYRELTPPGKEYIRQTMALAKVSYCEKNYPLSDLEEAN